MEYYFAKNSVKQQNKIKLTFNLKFFSSADSTDAAALRPSSAAVGACADGGADAASSTHSLTASDAQRSSAAVTTCCAGASSVVSRSTAPRSMQGSDSARNGAGDCSASVGVITVATATSAQSVRRCSRDRTEGESDAESFGDDNVAAEPSGDAAEIEVGRFGASASS